MSKLTQIARELLAIDEDLAGRVLHLQSKMPKITVGNVTLTSGEPHDCYELYTFEQTWGNTSGGFEGIGGCAMTTERTYVLVPNGNFDDECFVYFGGRFAYSVPFSDEFMQDIRNHCVAGKKSYSRYLNTSENKIKGEESSER